MTGYGRSEAGPSESPLVVEIRSLNSRNFDLILKLPSAIRDKESILRQKLSEELHRGKISLSVKMEALDEQANLNINKATFAKIVNQIGDLADDQGLDKSELLSIVIRLPEVWNSEPQTKEIENWDEILQTILKSVAELKTFRAKEGKSLEAELVNRVTQIQNLLVEVEKLDPQRIPDIKAKMQQKIQDCLGTEKLDQNRIEQEILHYIEKLDITEEKVRLTAHCEFFLETIGTKEDCSGKKLGFIAQEMGREINTLGSKANNSDIQRLVVQMKDELEKIKEQVMNVL